MAASPEQMRSGVPSAESPAAMPGAAMSGIGRRILAAHAVAARFYRAQLIAEDGTTARDALGRVGVPVDGPWVAGYAPDRPTGVVNELRRNGFNDAEIRASGLARTSKSGALVDRFRNRVMVGVRGVVDGEQGVVAFVGYRPPGAPSDVPAIVYGPASAIHHPNSTLFGVREQAGRVGGAAVIANDPLEAMIVAGQTVDDPLAPLVVAPAGPALTPTQVEELGRVAGPAAEVTVTVRPGPAGSRAAGRAYTLLTSASEEAARGRRLLAARRYGDLRDVRALVEFVVRDGPKGAVGARPPDLVESQRGADSAEVMAEVASELETSDDRSQGHESFEAVESSFADDSPPVESSQGEGLTEQTSLGSAGRAPAAEEHQPSEPVKPIEASVEMGRALPKRARPVPGVEGYHSLLEFGGTTVYGPDNAPIAVGTWKDHVKVAEVDGTRIIAAGHDFDVVAARQHRISGLAPDELDHVWVEITPDSSARAGYVVVVHGIVKGNGRDDWLINGPASFVWSAKRKAHATRPNWTKAVVDRYCSTLLSELARQGRNAIVRNSPGLEQGQGDLRLEVEVEGEGPRDVQRPEISGDDDIVDESGEVEKDYETENGTVSPPSGGPAGASQLPFGWGAQQQPPPLDGDAPPSAPAEAPPDVTATPPSDAEEAPSSEAPERELPPGAQPVAGVDGYHYAHTENHVAVYGPNGALIATGEQQGRVVAGDVDGVRITGAAHGSRSFAVHVARQHRAASLPAEKRDRVTVELVPDREAEAGYVIVVRGTLPRDPGDERATADVAIFPWSEQRGAHVSQMGWTKPTVDLKLARLLGEFARQGRDVVVSQAGDLGWEQEMPVHSEASAGLPAAETEPEGIPWDVAPVDQSAESDDDHEPVVPTTEPDVHVLPDDVHPVDGVDGYHYGHTTDGITVYGPDNAPVATTKDVDGIQIGDVEGAHIPASGWGSGRFPRLAALQHRTASLPEQQRDRVTVEIVPDSEARSGYVVVVRGTDKDNSADKGAVKTAGHFLFSGKRQAWVSGRAWKRERVEANFARLLGAFADQGRNVLVIGSRAEVEAPAATPDQPTATSDESPQPTTPDPRSLSDDELMAAYRAADQQAGYRAHRNEVVAARADELKRLCEERVQSRIDQWQDVVGLLDEELAAEDKWLNCDLVRSTFSVLSESGGAVRERTKAVRNERRARKALTLTAGLEPGGLADDALGAMYEAVHHEYLLLDSQHRDRPTIKTHVRALISELGARRVRHYEQRPPAAQLTLEELIEERRELADLSEAHGLRHSDDVTAARLQRLRDVDFEIDRIEAPRFSNELARVDVTGDARSSDVSIDGMLRAYGEVKASKSGFEARVKYQTHDIFPTRLAAIAALVRRYDQDPDTLPQRRWGRARDILVPVTAKELLADWLWRRRDGDTTLEWERLSDILAGFPTQLTVESPLNGKPMRVYPFSVEEGLLDELIRIGERIVADLRQEAANKEIEPRERAVAKRRIPPMGAALHELNRQRDRAREAGADTDRRAIDESQVAAQLAALAEEVNGGSDESESIQPDGEAALGAVPPARVGDDPGPGGVLRVEGTGAAGSDGRDHRAAGRLRPRAPRPHGRPGVAGCRDTDGRARGGRHAGSRGRGAVAGAVARQRARAGVQRTCADRGRGRRSRLRLLIEVAALVDAIARRAPSLSVG